MTVEALIAELQQLNPTDQVLISSDEEGNHIRSCYGTSKHRALVPSGGHEIQIIDPEDIGVPGEDNWDKHDPDELNYVVVIW